MNEVSQWQTIRNIHRDYAGFYKVFGGIILIVFGTWIGSIIFASDGGYATNLYTEILSIGITIFVLDRLARRREVRERQEQLVINAASVSNETAKQALDEMWRRGWRGDLLAGKGLTGANWQDAHFGNADLSNSELYLANLENSDARYVDFSGTNLRKAKLDGMLIWKTRCDQNTVLPNGTKCNHDADLLLFGAKLNPPDVWYLSDHVSIKITHEEEYQEKLRLLEGLKDHFQSGNIDDHWIVDKLHLSIEDIKYLMDDDLFDDEGDEE